MADQEKVSLGLGKAHQYKEENLEKVPDCAGNFALGILHKDGFVPVYVGRSDEKRLKEEIKQRAKAKKEEGHKFFHFKWKCIGDKEDKLEAYYRECQNYHDFEKTLRGNKNHPDLPDHAPKDVKCPICGNPEEENKF